MLKKGTFKTHTHTNFFLEPILTTDRFFLRNDTKIRNKRNDHQIWPFFLRNEFLLMKSLKILFAQWEFTLVTIRILFAQCKFFLRNETFDSKILNSFFAMIKNASIRKSYSLILHKARFQMSFPHLLAMLAYNKKIFFLLLTKFILRNVPKSDKILIIQWYAKSELS